MKLTRNARLQRDDDRRVMCGNPACNKDIAAIKVIGPEGNGGARLRYLMLRPGLKIDEFGIYRPTRYAAKRAARGQPMKSRTVMRMAFGDDSQHSEGGKQEPASRFGGQPLTPLLHFPVSAECSCGTINLFDPIELRVESFG